MSRFDTLFVITYGRSGSTLLQGILNSIDGYLIRGENNSTLYEIYRTYHALDYGRFHYGKDRRRTYDPWYGMDRVDPIAFLKKVLAAFKAEVIKPEPGHRVIGFKEIRYSHLYIADDEDYFEYLAFLRRFFPGSAFIFNERDIEATSKDGWWAENPESKAHLEAALERMRKAYALYPECSCWVSYDAYIQDIAALKDMFTFLGEPFEPEKIRRVLAVDHSY